MSKPTVASLAADVAALVAIVQTLTDAVAGAPVAPSAKSTAKPLSALRAAGAGGVCTAHGGTCGKDGTGRFATAKGAAYHAEHSGGAF